MTETLERSTVDPSEVEKFTRLAQEWWNPAGKFKTLHKFNPVRLKFIRDHAAAHFGRDPRDARCLEGLSLLDIGCGGGLLCEPMARLGANVTGADPTRTNIEVAKIHAEQSGLDITYRADTAEALEAEGAHFDILLNMEVVEHVADVALFLDACAKMVTPGGIMFVATLNRTAKSFALAIVGAEYILGWIPRGTHEWNRFLKPEEINAHLDRNGMTLGDQTGVFYNVLADEWRLSRDMDVNYMLYATRPGEASS
ncbi:MAG: bifunctional 2-polyprenyl-6-hydroxyphenol methylase/3-demethylubiquinol 3-O-methyltransferase UbiG [Pseudomonadota bacterium]